MQLKEICRFLESKYPLQLQESYDNAGLIYGHTLTEIKSILVTLDVTEDIVDEAIELNCNLIIAHHPIVFKGLKKINGNNYVERVVEKCIQNGIALYAIHTNLDNHYQGVNARISAKLNLINCKILKPMESLLYKLEVYVPMSHLEQVDQAILNAGAGQIGNYTECHFRTAGKGTFTPTGTAQPHIGSLHKRELVDEYKVEYLVESFRLPLVLEAMQETHPYEEVAFHVLATHNKHQNRGAGMIGELIEPMDTLSFLKQIKETFQCGIIKHTPIVKDQVQRIALCGGAGSFLLSDAKGAKADIFITSDFKYHEFFDAENKIVIADIGHYESEQFTSELLAEQLMEKFPNFAVHLTKLNTNPVNYL